MNIGKLTSVSAIGAHQLALNWDDGKRASIDLDALIEADERMAPLKQSREFLSVALSADGWSIEWPSGIDFGSPQLRRWADEQAGQTMPAEDFRRWIERHRLTLDKAADALGLSRRTIAYYLSGEQVIPKTVMLATEGWDRRAAA